MKPSRTMLYIGILVAIIIAIAFQGCKRDEVKPQAPLELITGGDVEVGSGKPNGWWSSTGQGKYTVTWTGDESFSPSKSLKISTQTTESSDFAFWGQTISTNIPYGKDVVLKVMVKGNLSGTGISIVIRGDETVFPEGGAEQFVTTQGTFPISGAFDWMEHSVKLATVEATIKSLTVYLVYLPNTSGEVYFDDISLTE